MKKVVMTFIVLMALIAVAAVGVWYWGLPDEYVSDKIESLAIAPVSIEVDGFSKRPFFAFDAGGLRMRKDGEEVWMISSLAGDIMPLQLLRGRAVIDVRGESYGGQVTGNIRAEKESQRVSIEFDNIQASEIAYLRTAGFDGDGLLSGSLTYAGGSGTLEFVMDNADLKGFSSDEIVLPLQYFHTVRGALALIQPNSIDIKSISLTGKGIYVRIKGKVAGGFADLQVEVMPEATFPETSLLMLIDRYKISDGYYYIPVKRRL